MDADRWKRVDELFHAALRRPAGERRAFLEESCGGDRELFDEVASLIQQDSDAFLEGGRPWDEALGTEPAVDTPSPLASERVGHYLMQGELGRGGMGVVYRAHDTQLDRPVALKVLPEELARDPEQLARFQQEARTLARITHANVATIHGLDTTEDGTRFLVLELIEGQSLSRRLRDGAIPMLAALSMARQVAAGLAAAHAHGVIHRDLKPGNVMVDPEGTVKVLDFGLAKSTEAARESRTPAPAEIDDAEPSFDTRAGSVVGTPGYMSPEQVRGEELDARTDVFAFGCVLYECLTGGKAFPGDTTLDRIDATLHGTPDWAAFPPETSMSVRSLVQACVEKASSRRLSDMDAVLERLGQAEEESSPSHAVSEAPTNLPAELSSFVGREDDLSAVEELSSRARLVTLTGPGGCGKTRLAVQVARRLLSAHPDGTWFVELAPVSSPDAVERAVLAATGLSEQPNAPVLRTLTDGLRGRRVLVLLDNCEHVLDGCAALARELLRACPESRIVATSREPLGVSGETSYVVPSLPVPESTPDTATEVLEEVASVRLFVDRARAARPGFRLTPENATDVVAICRRLEGIPLAIELAAARVKAMTPATVVQRLAASFAILSSQRGAEPRQLTVRAAFDWSHDLLSDEERHLLHRLSVFVGGWTLEAAEAACSDERIGEDRVLDLLSALVDKSLVQHVDTTSGFGRYGMLETSRQTASEHLLAADETPRWRDRHLAYFLSAAEEAAPHLMGYGSPDLVELLEADRENFEAALHWCGQSEHGDELRLRLAGALARFWYRRGHYEVGRQALREALAWSGAADLPRERAAALQGAGVLAWCQTDNEEAWRLLEQSVELWRELGDAAALASAVGNQGLVAGRQGEHETACTLHEESLELHRELGDREGVIGALGNLAVLAVERGDYEAACTFHDEQLDMLGSLGLKHAQCIALVNTAFARWHLGDYERSLGLADMAVDLAREVGDPTVEVTCDVNAGRALHGLGRLEDAEARLRDCLARARELGVVYYVTYAMNFLIGVRLDRGEWTFEDRQLVREVRELSEEAGLTHALVQGLALGAMGELRMGDVAKALESSARAVALIEEHPRLDVAEEEVLFHRHAVLSAAGREDEARTLLARAHDEMTAKAARISSAELREAFLERVPANRAIRAAWAQAAHGR